MEPEKMQAVYWDYIRADIYANEFLRKDSSKNIQLESAKLQLQVFKLHKTTREEFYRSYDYYLAHKELMMNMLDTMLVRQRIVTDSSKIKTDSSKIKTDSSKKVKDSSALRRIMPSMKKDSIKLAE